MTNEYQEEDIDQEITTSEEGGADGYTVELAKARTTAHRPRLVLQHQEEVDDNEPEGQLTIDVYQTPNEIVVESAVAGVDPDRDLDINVTTDSITIRGRRRKEHHIKTEDYFYQECYWGKFSRSVILPQEVDAERAHATFKNGVLAVHLPKLTRQQSKKLKVRIE
ncbi:MAG: Hsp20/alpha crystallin family protein [Anaplasmataceae bacterium]|nr:Hsp20/alpha crystallin family protein [Anaplasmataceae bacterium]